MKYGEQFERESVPQWSLHNIDYNSLKHHIKAHTTKDQAAAIAIPGRPNTALSKFEDDFYSELCRQHARVGLFVSSKADELARRLQHLSNQIHRLILRCATSGQEHMPLKRRQRFAKYEQTMLKCGDDIKSLQRFVDAQVVAFRKILKKYRKWTGSSALGSRFKENVLSEPKSFTRRDFSHLQTQYDDLLMTLHSALPAGGFALPDPESHPPRPPSSQVSPSETIVATESQPSAGYWNEYECGSEAGDFEGNANEYAIYVDPNADVSLPGMKALSLFFSKPIHKLSAWVTHHHPSQHPNPERDPLLPTHHRHTSTLPYGATRTPPELSYFSTPPGATYTSTNTAAGTETDLDESDAHTATSPSSRFPSNRHSRRGSGSFSRGYISSSSDDQHLPGSAQGYSTYYSLPSITDQRAARTRERALRWATGGCFGVAFVLMGIAALLIATGRHKMRLEVDAGVTVGIVTSLGAACAGLCMAGARKDRVGVVERLVVWAAFAGVCVVNGVLLVLVMGNAARV